MSKKIIQILFFIILVAGISRAQISSPSIGTSFHLGDIKGNSTSVTSAGGTIFIDFFPWFENDVSFRLGYTYSQMVEKFLPENRQGRYYPFVKFISLKGFIRQDISFPIYIEEGAGLIYLNDRTFSDTNLWEPGIAFSASCGFDFRKIGSTGFTLGLGFDYGLTFTNTTANYFLYHAQVHYHF